MNTITMVVPGSDHDVSIESSFTHLNALGFVRGATSLDQCFLLVSEGWSKTHFPVNEVIRGYLVTMLHRYLTHKELFAQLSAFNYAVHLFGKRELDAPCIHDVADMCLQCAAFFPEITERRHEMKSHKNIIDIGVALYGQLARASSGKDDCFSIAFPHMAEHFAQAMLVLRSACPQFVQKKEEFSGIKKDAIPLLLDGEAEKVNRAVSELEQLFFESHTCATTNQLQ